MEQWMDAKHFGRENIVVVVAISIMVNCKSFEWMGVQWTVCVCVAKLNVGKNAIIIDSLQIAIQQYNAMFDRHRERERETSEGRWEEIKLLFGSVKNAAVIFTWWRGSIVTQDSRNVSTCNVKPLFVVNKHHYDLFRWFFLFLLLRLLVLLILVIQPNITLCEFWVVNARPIDHLSNGVNAHLFTHKRFAKNSQQHCHFRLWWIRRKLNNMLGLSFNSGAIAMKYDESTKSFRTFI